MNVFEAVKQSVTTRQAAEYYGIHVGRNGMACCPFHNDKTPSMKLDRRLTRDDGVRYLDSLFETIKRDYDIRDLEYMIGEVVDAAERRVITNQSMKFFLRLIEVRPNIKICFDTPQKADELLRLKAKGAYQGVIILQRDINSTNATPEQVIRRYPRLKLCDGYIPTVETMNYTASPDDRDDGFMVIFEPLNESELDYLNKAYLAEGPDVKFCVSVFRQSQEWRLKAGQILA